MSEIKVNSIKGVGASAAAITVNNTDGTCTANITNKPNRNLIINGAMQVAQRGTSATAISSGHNYTTVDRFQQSCSNLGNTPDIAQSTISSGNAYDNGFRTAYRVTNGDNSATSDDQLKTNYKIEAQDLAQSGWNHKSASSYLTLSFWVKSSVAQTFSLAIYAEDSNMAYGFQYSATTSWTKITHSIPGHASLGINNDNGAAFNIQWYQYMGTDTTSSGFTNSDWHTYNGSSRATDMTASWFNTNDATFEITGVQLEVGSVATDFEHRSFGQELLLCQRYYQEVGMSVQMAGASSGSSALGNVNVPIACAMRAAPTVASGVTYHMWHGDNDGRNNNGTAMTIQSYSTNHPEHSTALKGNVTGFSGVTDNRSGSVCSNSGTVIKLSAEL